MAFEECFFSKINLSITFDRRFTYLLLFGNVTDNKICVFIQILIVNLVFIDKRKKILNDIIICKISQIEI